MADQTHGLGSSPEDPNGDPNEEELREIEGFLGGGESPFSRGPAASALPEQNLDHDRYDRRLWREILDASAELSSLQGDEEAPPTFSALLEDLFLSYFKAQPDLLPETGVEPRHRRANRPFVERTLDDPDTYRARATTRLDVPASALSALAAGERFLEEVKNRPSLANFFDEAAEQPPDLPPPPEEEPEGTPPGTPQGSPQNAPHPEDERGDGDGETPQEPSPELPGRDARRAARAAANAGREEAENLAGALSGWGLSPADLKRVPLGERLRLLKALSAQEMGRLIDLVGKMRFLARQKAREKVRERRDEVHSIELSGDLSRLLPSELALIASPQEERALAALGRLARGESLSWELRGKEKEKKGPLIALIDCSGSMDDPFGGGSPGASAASPSTHKKMEWATAVALGLVDLAAGRGGAPKRASAVLFFNAQVVHEVRFAPGEKDARKLLGVATVRAGGGTDYVPAIVRALEIAAESEYRGADLVLVTDELCRVGDRFLEGFLAEKARLKLRLLSVVIGYASTGELGRYSDRVWALTDLAGPAMGAAGEVFGLI